MKRFISRRSFLKTAGVTTAAAAVAVGAPSASACFGKGKLPEITILYTNDVHTYIDHKSPELTYASIAALKKSYEEQGKNVLLVDAGDHIQGTAYGSMDDGATIIRLMNEAGYDLATPGNHEFDYGMDRAKMVLKEADFPYVSCNWIDLRSGLRVLPSIKLFNIQGAFVAFVGITTPETFTKSTPAYFMNAKQTRYIYDILGGDDGAKLYDAVQKAIDKAKTLGADYIIGLGHLGVDPSSAPWTSKDVIGDPEKPLYSKTLNCQHFGNALYSIMKWNPDYTYKVRGTWASRRGEQIIVFNLPNAVPVMLIPADDGGEEAKQKKRITLCPEEWENDFGDEFYEHTVENGFYYIAPNTEWHSQARSVVAPGVEQYMGPSQEQLQMTIDDLLRGTNKIDGNKGN